MEQEINWESIGNYSVENRPNFWKAIFLSVTKPHLINRRLAGAEQISIHRCNFGRPNTKYFDRIAHTAQNTISTDLDENNILPTILRETNLADEFHEIDLQCASTHDLNEEKVALIILSKLVPKNLATNKITYELAILDTINSEVAFISLLKNQTTGFIKRFKFKLNDIGDGCTEMHVDVSSEDAENLSRLSDWIKSVFVPKILKWTVSIEDYEMKSEKCGFNSIESLSLINISEYNQLYNDLKVKYGEHMVKIWPEQTDPAKFVHEDVAIATYLILLWREERSRLNTDRLQSFVDLGCGNGLLVYILSGEGHLGYGIDVRKRGIWDLYPPTTVLKVEAIVPSDSSIFPDIDWIIGNHSDELSPWLPVIAARSSYQSRYFLLPCCAFEFNGKKFQRRCSSVSQYMDFLNYAKEISDVCGFKTHIDRLKIPSTKRICLVGYERVYSPDQQSAHEQQIQEFINARSINSTTTPTNDTTNWNNDFQPRSSTEKVQNCTTINKNIQNEIVERVFSHLLQKKRYLTESHQPHWNLGGKVSLNDLAKLIPSDQLKALKKECGGLQTLLRNHSQIFRVVNGVVEIKAPMKWCDKKRELEARGVEVRVKLKKCWFHEKHPDGCPLDDNECSYVH